LEIKAKMTGYEIFASCLRGSSMNRIVPLLALVAVAVAVSACGHTASQAATSTPPAAAPSPSPAATPLIENTLADQAACAGFEAGYNSDFASVTQSQINAEVNTTTNHVDPVLVQDVNMWLTDSQRQGIASDATDATKIFAACHSIGQ
jgi:hypothetical protein